MLDYGFALFLIAMLIQGIFNLYLTLYVWEKPERLDETASPAAFLPPMLGFTVLIPARHEQSVIGNTIRRVINASYPARLLEIIVICDSSDTETIRVAKEAISESNKLNARVLEYSSLPINKPHGLNEGLAVATQPIITIFDAEDDIHPDIFNVANTIFLTKRPDLIQAGVQLMNYASTWFSVHNVLEYFFWFKSRMHFYARANMVPLGGNTVFFRRKQLLQIGGWDQACLTEDADIGIRLSMIGAKVHATYDARHITKEETPSTIAEFIKQRTRWNQGFIQILKKGAWRRFPSLKQRVLAVYVLSFPLVQSALLILTPIILLLGIFGHLPLGLSLLSFMPLLVVVVQLVMQLVGLWEFRREQNLPFSLRSFLAVIWGFLPYQALLAVAAVRATWREARGQNNWEKTSHAGLHRSTMTLDRLPEERATEDRILTGLPS